MRSRIPTTDRFGEQNAEKEAQGRKLDDALRIDGSQFVRLYEKMQELIAGLGTTVSNLVAQLTYTRAEVDDKLDDVDTALAGKAPTVHTHTQEQVTGVWSKNVDNGSSGTVRTGDVYAPGAVAYNITGTRRTVWIEDATGRLGYAPSTETAKTHIRAADIDPAAVLAIEPVVFEYVAEWEERRRRAALPSPYRDWNPDYEVHTETGFIAEHLDRAGLGFCVIYAPDGTVQGIELSQFVIAQQAALRHLAANVQDLSARLSRLEAS